MVPEGGLCVVTDRGLNRMGTGGSVIRIRPARWIDHRIVIPVPCNYMIRVAYQTLGCKVNQYETEKIRESLERAGLVTVPFSSAADAYIINTCSVTAEADAKSRAAVRKALRANSDAYVIVSGCYAELEPVSIEQIEGVDLIIPNAEKEAIPERILAHFGVAPQSTIPNPQSIRPRTRTRAVVKVQDGCDQFCSYCVIPYARSNKTSRAIDDVRAELESLAGFGYKEIVLAGIRLGSYESGGARLPELVRMASCVEGIERVRLSSIEPWEVDDELLDAMDSSKACRHLHIPLQSGDDEVLARMNRPYTSERYRDVVRRVRERIPGIGITTDVIVGFPGETDTAFENTAKLIEEIDFSRLHVLRYSARKRTVAAGFAQQVEAGIKQNRAAKLIELGKHAMMRFAGSFTGKTLRVLVESQIDPERVSGFADNYVEVSLPGDASLRGHIVKARITGVDETGRATGETAH